MSKTYKTDNSFFMYVTFPMSYLGISEVKYWFHCIAPKTAMYRLIVDEELDTEKVNLQQREEYYPCTKVIAVVMNPWARIRLAYLVMAENKDPRADCDFHTFVNFLYEKRPKDTSNNTRMNALQPQVDWIRYTDENGNIREADYIFKVETLDEDFKVIQDYFECQEPLQWFSKIPEYREHYDKKTKSLVAKMFAADIEKFGYKF